MFDCITFAYPVMNLLRASMLCVMTASACWAVEPKASFPDEVNRLMRSPWTEMVITTALVTDFGEVYATSIHLKRSDATKLPVARSTGTDSPENSLTASDWKELSETLAMAAKTTFEHRYPLEIYRSLPPEEARKLIESGQLKIRATDVEVLRIKATMPTGAVELMELGPYQPLDTLIQRLLKTKARELKSSEYQEILGRDPYAEA